MPDPDMAESPTSEFPMGYKAPVFNRVANYFAGQPYGNLLSTIMICGFGYWFWWSQTVGEAQKAKQIQEGMSTVIAAGQSATDKLTAQHIEASKSAAAQNSAAVKALGDNHAAIFKEAMDHAEKAATRRESEMQFLRDLVTGKRHIEKTELEPGEKFPFSFGGNFPAEPGPPGT